MNQTSGKFWTNEALRVTRRAVLLGGLVIGTTGAWAQASVSDAQVEANVLKALAGSTQLSNEAITTRTVYGTVTLSGSVRDEPTRQLAESLAANANGVKKVIDELTLGAATAVAQPSVNAAGSSAQGGAPAPAPLVLQSDGTYAPLSSTDPVPGSAPAEQAQRNDPEADQALDQQMGTNQQPAPSANPAPGGNSQVGTPPAGSPDASQPPLYRRRRPMANYPPDVYPPQPGGYAQGPYQAPYQSQYPGQSPSGGQAAGQVVVIPAGALVRVRVNRTLSSDHSQPGTPFDGTVVNDVIAGGFVAIPRGAAVQGTVVDSKSSGVLKGRGELSIQLTQVVLGGKTYPVQSDLWAHHGGDKTTETIDKTAGFGAVGAAIGALGGGGVGAAVGGGVGAALGLGSSATSGRGQVFIPAEGLVTFHLAQAATVQTVSEQEMQRLAYGVPAGSDQRYLRPRPRVYVGPVVGYPGYYPYGPYGYPAY